MPRPPLLPLIDWPAVFGSGATYEAWLVGAESEERRPTRQRHRPCTVSRRAGGCAPARQAA